MDRLAESLRSAPVVELEGYHYFVHPVSDGVPPLEPALLREIVVRILRAVDLDDVDKIVAPEAMGIHISTAVSLATDIPMVVVRKRQYGLPGEVGIFQETGYDENQMYVNDVEAGDRVILIDDVLATGGTMTAVIEALEDIGADVADVVAVIEKVGLGADVEATGHDPTTLITVDVVDGEVVIVDEDGRA